MKPLDEPPAHAGGKAVLNIHQWGQTPLMAAFHETGLIGQLGAGATVQYECEPGLQRFVLWSPQLIGDGPECVVMADMRADHQYDLIIEGASLWVAVPAFHACARDDARLKEVRAFLESDAIRLGLAEDADSRARIARYESRSRDKLVKLLHMAEIDADGLAVLRFEPTDGRGVVSN